AALFVIPPALGDGNGRWAIPVAILFAVGHGAALVGVARSRDWGRNLTVFVAELGGGLAILDGVALAILDGVALLVGARPFGPDAAAGPGLVAWTAAVYTLLGIAAGRVPVVARLGPIERRRVVYGPSFAEIVR
ncbi:MAG TPA: hypothetical protein VHM48_06660, partial [Candidatus Limnocylindrales bacterium]|nr:hypothetical protein [Candidatus Limnocylindrales bacterium]